MIQLNCSCGFNLQADADRKGLTIRCPACGRENRIPDGEGVQTAGPAHVSAPPPERPANAGGNERLVPPATSRIAVASAVLGVLSLFCNVWTAVPALVLGAVALWDVGRSRGRKKGTVLAAVGMVAAVALPVIAFVIVQSVQDMANRVSSANNLKQITLGMLSYHDANEAFPPAAVCDADGKPLLSWRVLILPYIEESARYQKFKMDEPWDGPHNIKLLTPAPRNYLMPGDRNAPPGYTYYRVFVGHGAAFDVPKPFGPNHVTSGVNMAQFNDGTANTILIVEAATAVPWTKPDELDYDPDGPLPPLGGHFGGGFAALMADGSIRQVSKDVSESTLRAAITRSGGDKLGPDW